MSVGFIEILEGGVGGALAKWVALGPLLPDILTLFGDLLLLLLR